jgi:hypothetical protein
MQRALGVAGARIGQLIVLPKETGPALLASKSGDARPTPIEAGREDKLTVTVAARFELTPVSADQGGKLGAQGLVLATPWSGKGEPIQAGAAEK